MRRPETETEILTSPHGQWLHSPSKECSINYPGWGQGQEYDYGRGGWTPLGETRKKTPPMVIMRCDLEPVTNALATGYKP